MLCTELPRLVAPCGQGQEAEQGVLPGGVGHSAGALPGGSACHAVLPGMLYIAFKHTQRGSAAVFAALQKIQDWLKESGQLTDQSLAAFQRNPAGPK